MDALDRRIVVATQAGLPLELAPYAVIAEQVGATEAEVIARIRAMLERGAIRRIGAVPNHYALGYVANGMSVWDIDDARVDAVGATLGALDRVTHCYRRPRRGARWPYNLFAMVHATTREAALEQVKGLAALIERDFPGACRGHDVLFSSAILKKTGLRLAE